MADSVRSMLTAYTTAQWTANCLSHSSSHRSDSQIFVENRDLCLPHLHSTPLSGEYSHNVWYGKTRMVWLPDHEKIFKICLFISTEYTNVNRGIKSTTNEMHSMQQCHWQVTNQQTDRQSKNRVGWLEFNGTFSTKRQKLKSLDVSRASLSAAAATLPFMPTWPGIQQKIMS